MSEQNSLEFAKRQIASTRAYTLTLIDTIDHADWFRQPAEGLTHVAWQVGHLAMAQYGLCLFRIRGRQEIDLELMSSTFRKRFSRGSTPNPDPEQNPAPEEIRGVFDRVYDQAMQEMAGYTDEKLSEPVDEPYTAYATKLGALLFCSHHEMLHVGQIGLLRRLLGYDSVR